MVDAEAQIDWEIRKNSRRYGLSYRGDWFQMLRDCADCCEHVRVEMAFTANQHDQIRAVGDNWDDLWLAMKERSIKPIALRAIQGHKHKVTAETPYDDRFEEEDARGDLRTTSLKHSSEGGKIPFLVHSTKRGVQNTIIESILQNDLYNVGLDNKKTNVYFSAANWRGLDRSEWSNADFNAAWQCEEAIVWPYWPRDQDDCIVIVEVDRMLDLGITAWQTASAAVLAQDYEMIPVQCIAFSFCTVTGACLHNDTGLTWEEYVEDGPSQGGARPESEDEDEAEQARDELIGRAAAREPEAMAQVHEALANAQQYVRANRTILCPSAICGFPMRQGAEFCSQCGTPAARRRERSRSARPRREATAESSGSEGAPSIVAVDEQEIYPQAPTQESRERLYDGMTLEMRRAHARQAAHYSNSSSAAIKKWRKAFLKLDKNSGFSTPAHSFQEKWQVDTIWRDNLIRTGQSVDYGRMVDALNRDEIRVAQGGIFPRYPNMATCRDMDRCANLPAPTGYLDVERFNRRVAERDLGEGAHRLVLGNDGGNPTNLSAYHHPNAESLLQRMREKGLKGTGRGKGAKSKSSAGRDSQQSSASRSRSSYNQRNDDWTNYDRREMRSSASSGSNQPFNAFGDSRQSTSNSAGSSSWSNNFDSSNADNWNTSRAGWVARNEQRPSESQFRQQQPKKKVNWENLNERNDQW